MRASTIFSIRLSSKDLKAALVSNIQKVYPETQVDVGDVKYNLGFSLRFEISQLDIKLKKDQLGKELFYADKAFVRIPIWVFLFNKGEVDIILSSPKINYYEHRNGRHNWSWKKKANKKVINYLPKGKETKVNIRSNNITVFYQTREDFQGEFNIKKLLLKDVTSKKPAALEVQSALKIGESELHLFSGNFLLVGEFDTRAFLEKGIVKANGEMRLSKNRSNYFSHDIPDLGAEVALQSKKKSIAIHFKLHPSDMVDSLEAEMTWRDILRVNRLQGHL